MIVNFVGGLDKNNNCEVGLYEVNGVPLRSQVVTAMYEIYVRQEWARANDLTGSIKLSEYLMGTTTDRTLVDSGEGTTCRMPVLTRRSAYTEDGSRCSPNSTATFTDGTAIVILCGRAAQTMHIKDLAVFFHPMEQI